MHETSIVNSIIKTLEQEFNDEKLKTMKAIYLKVGVLSNIEPRLLHNAYQAYHYCGSKYNNVELYIESTTIKIKCDSCYQITDVKNYTFKCKHCNRPSKNIIQGEEMLIHKIEFYD